jgi:hypothetical protein
LSNSVSALWRTANICAAAVVAAAGLAALSPAVAAGSGVVCDGTVGRRMVDRVVIPNGATCRLNGTTVQQNVVVGPRASLVTNNARLLGSVQATERPRSVRILDTNVRGNIDVREATGTILIGNAGCGLDPSAGNNIHLVDNSGPIGLCRMRIRGNVHAINNSQQQRGVPRQPHHHRLRQLRRRGDAAPVRRPRLEPLRGRSSFCP